MGVGRFSLHPLPVAFVVATSFIGGVSAVADERMGTAVTTQAPLSVDVSEWPSFEEADRVYHEAILEGMAIEGRVAGLKAGTDGSARTHAQRLYLASLLQWRHGDREAALSSVDEALEVDRHGALLHQRGRLLEALGRIDEAIESYREALPLLSGSSRADTELRMALLIASERGEIDSLLMLAGNGDAALRNRVALVLAVLGHADQAARLYTLPASTSAAAQWRHALRLTEWGLWARDPGKAQETAWRAVDLAQNEQDRLYALALLTEAYRQADALPELVEILESGRDLGGDSRALWVSLLREIDRPDDALAALEGSAEHEPPAVKRQFLGIYRESDRRTAMVAELERLMAVDPDETIWPQGLAEFHLELGDRSSAEAAWRQFVDRAGSAPALLDGAAAMLKLGFEDLALAAAEKAQRNTAVNRAGRDAALDRAARFRFELYLQRGRRDEAREVLESLEAATAASDPMRQSIAMAYERLSLPAEARRLMRALIASGAGPDTAAREYLADLLVRSREPQRAVALLMEALPDASASQRRLLHTRLIAAARAAGTEDTLLADLTAKLDDGRATAYEAQLLIDMRIRAGEEAEALAVIETLHGQAGADPLEKLRQVAALYRVAADRARLLPHQSVPDREYALSRALAYDDALAQLAEEDADNAVFHIRSRIMHYIENLRFAAENDQEVSDTLIALLERYLAVSEMGADREFVAGVLVLGGQPQAAIGIYREILAVDPSSLDSYLEIGSQLEALAQAPRAVGMYQYLLESADREEVSWVALDGILNLRSDRATLDWARRMALLRLSAAPEQFEYYRQLADLSADLGDNDRQIAALYNGLAAGPELRLPTLRELLRATEDSGQGPAPAIVNPGVGLAVVGQGAGMAILGQGAGLSQGAGLTMVNPGSGVAVDEGLEESSNQRHVAFGRRLLALELAVPPDVYLSLGRTMIEAGDTDAALSAVNQAVESTGSDALLIQAAGIFSRAGDDLSAHGLFERALRNDPDNLDLLVDAAWSNERLGRRERAGELFLNGLTTLLAHQPLRVEEVLVAASRLDRSAASLADGELHRLLLDEGRELFPLQGGPGRSHSVEYQQYYIPLRNGLVRSLLGDLGQRDATFRRLWDDYASTLALVRARQSVEPDSNQLPPRPSALPRLANYPRLQFKAQMLRYLAYTFGDYATVNELDGTLLTLFPDDRPLPAILASHRSEWGSFAYPDPLENAGTSNAEQKPASAADGGEGLPAVRTTFPEAPPSAEAVLQATLNTALRSGDAAATLGIVKQLAKTDLIWETLEEVEPYLSPAGRKAVAEHVITVLHSDPDRAADSLRVPFSNAAFSHDLARWPRSWAVKLEDWSGDRVFDDERLMTLVRTGVPQAGDPQLGIPDVWFIYHALSAANRDRWTKALAEQHNLSSQYFTLISLLLQVEQDEAGADSLRAMIRDYEQVFNPLLLTLYRVDIHPANVPLARELVAMARSKFPAAFERISVFFPGPLFEPNFLRCEGRPEEALGKLIDLLVEHYFDNGEAMIDAATVLQFFPSLVSGNESKLIEILERRDLASPEATRQRNLVRVRLRLLEQLRRPLQSFDPQPLLSAVRDALQSDPSNRGFMQVASSFYALTGKRFAAQEYLRKQLQHFSGDESEAQLYTALLQALNRSAIRLDHPINAVAYRNALRRSPWANRHATAAGDQPGGNQDAVARVLNGEDHARLTREMARLWQTVVVTEQTEHQKPGIAGVTRLADIDGTLLNSEQAVVAMLRKHGYTNRSDVDSTLSALPDIVGMSLYRRQILNAFALVREHGEKPSARPMLSALAAHPLGMEILEGWATTVRGRMLEQALELIDALAEAHVHQGSAAARFTELGTAVRERRADDKALSLWLAIGSRVPELAASDEAGAVLAAHAAPETAKRPSLLLGMAKFLAVRGDQQGALRNFTSLLHWVHGRSLALDDTPASVFPIAAILTAARETLDAGVYRLLVRETLDLIEPWESHLLPAYSEFVLNQFDLADDRQAFYLAFKPDVDAAFQTLGGAEEDSFLLMRAAITQVRSDRRLAALDTLRKAMEARQAMEVKASLESSGHLAHMMQSHNAGEAANPRRQIREDYETARFSRILGLDRPEFTWADGEDVQIALTLAHPDGDLPGLLFAEADSVWLRQAESRIRAWIDTGEIDRSLGLEMLVSLVRASRGPGADTEFGDLLVYLKAQLSDEDEIALETAAAIAALAEEFGEDLGDIELEKGLLRKGAIAPERMAAVLRRIAAAEGEAAALEVGSGLLEFTLNDALMAELIALADANARSAQADEWRLLQREARLARAELQRTEALTQVF